MERVFILPCESGNPKYDITEVINHAGDRKYLQLLEELEDVRKLLLMFRLVKYHETIPDIELSIKNRDKQLCKPLLRLFQGSKCQGEIKDALSKLIVDKRERKIETLDARLYEIIVNLVGKEGVKLTNKQIWEAVKENIPGYESSLNAYQTDEFYEITKNKVNAILKDRFGAKPCYASPEWKDRGLAFNNETLKRLSNNYGKLEGIKILPDTSDTSDTSDGFIHKIDEIFKDSTVKIEHELGDIDPENGPKNTYTHVKKVSETSGESKPPLMQTCPNCGKTGEAFYMRIHRCE